MLADEHALKSMSRTLTVALIVVACESGASQPSPALENQVAESPPPIETVAITQGDSLTIEEWPVPWETTRPRDPFVGPDGRIWFVGQTGDYVAALDPSFGMFQRFPLNPGAGPHNVIVAADGTVWYAGNKAAHIGRLDPSTGEIVKITMPEGVSDPHTLMFDPVGDIWFSVQHSNAIGRLAIGTGDVDIVRVPTAGARPYGIVVDPDGRPWVAEFGSNKLATIDPSGFTLREFELPRPGARPRRLAVTSDRAVWYVDYAEGFLGRFDPASESFLEWPIPGGRNARPYAMASDDRDRLWFVETGAIPNRLIGFDPKSEHFIASVEIPSGGHVVRHMVFHAPTRALWFGTDTNTVARAIVP